MATNDLRLENWATDDLAAALRAVVEAWRVHWWPPLADNSDWACWNFGDLVARLVAVVEGRFHHSDPEWKEESAPWPMDGTHLNRAELVQTREAVRAGETLSVYWQRRLWTTMELAMARADQADRLERECQEARTLAWETGERLDEQRDRNQQIGSVGMLVIQERDALRTRLARVEGALRRALFHHSDAPDVCGYCEYVRRDTREYHRPGCPGEALAEDAGVGQGTSRKEP